MQLIYAAIMMGKFSKAMSYLSKVERKQQILDIAMMMALEDGLNTLTVRNIAQKAALSVGLIHHHFATIQTLKCEVFIQLVYQCLDPQRIKQNLDLTEKLLFVLGFTEREREFPYIRLWNDAEKNSQLSTEFQRVFMMSMDAWHHAVKTLLETNQAVEVQTLDDIAWQLIGLTLGLESLSKFHGQLFTHHYAIQLVTTFIEDKLIKPEKMLKSHH
ncbi:MULTISPECIES: TetR family transcriptional regulator [unclassified Acinetobacter]|uniref:TetR family transcriptional regulator n=1 Tax=unclassified Acinetobacter TaxID=196816 RepID=UPI002934D8CE|nr:MULTISPECIES: TetR family transcriptional regulator [unclassified Acinetobacter]WOE33338.1 TetR family transcriptional regulator [Acinetobacter sp. SAAs470]WOE37003.1 TetR family transcriptional regulator [Acinetobacter sp. SAAs474]